MAVGQAEPDAGTGAVADVDPRLRDRLRTVVCCLALSALAFSTRPGAILADTKIDMALNPLGFLGRAVHPWDHEQFGQLQNQAVGYLFPMGPFYALGDLLDVPAWITQRFWFALLMCAAFLGVRLLAMRLGVGGPQTRLVGAAAYALAPNALATMGQLSSEYLPVAMLPWMLVPLVTAVESGDGRIRAAARSGIAVACCSGINASATVAVLVVPFLYLLTRPRGTRGRARLLAWWSAAVAVATSWWIVPLLLTGTYGYNWLAYTERAVTITGPTGLVNVLRGAERWVNYLVVDGLVWWPLGHALSLETLPMLCTAVVAGIGLAGLVHRALPERTFLLLSLLCGVAIISAGHISDVPGPLAPQMRDLLDGALAPFRNLFKFDALVRLPLALGLAHLLTVAARKRGVALGWPRTVRALLSAPVAAMVALGGIGVTAVAHGLAVPGEFTQVPRYWKDAATWLNARAGQQAVLAIPGAPFGEYLWGRPMDDLVQPMLTARWGVRQLVPLGSPGYTRALDAIEQQVRAGRSSPGLAEFLARMGVRYVLVRNDIRRERLRGGWPARIHQALDSSPGLSKVAAFGEPFGGDWVDDAVSAVNQKYQPVEVYEVEGAGPIAGLAHADDPVRVYGGPESLLAMADGGVLPRRPVLLNDDAPELGGAPVVTDSSRLARRSYGELHLWSQTLTEADRPRATDILAEGWERYATTVTYGGGIRNVVASSSAGGDDAIPNSRKPDAVPFAALDGNEFTAWETGGWLGPTGQWLRVDFDRPRFVPWLTAQFGTQPKVGPPVTRVAVETERGVVEQPVRAVTDPQPLRSPAGATRWVRIRITAVAASRADSALSRAAIAELVIGGVKPTRTYTLPAPKAGTAGASYVMSRAPGTAADCMKGAQRWVCSDTLGTRDEENNGFDRTFTATTAGRAELSGTAVLTDPKLIARYTEVRGATSVAASSANVSHPAAQARSAFDGDKGTVWVAAPDDLEPTLAVRWRRPVTLSRLTLTRPPGAGGPVEVLVEGARGQAREVVTDADGRMSFAPMVTDRLRLRFRPRNRLNPIQVGELEVPGVRPVPDIRTFPFQLNCGFGPQVRVGSAMVPTVATGTMGDLLEGRPLTFRACRSVSLAAGANRLSSGPFDPFRIETAVLEGPSTFSSVSAADELRPAQVLRWGAGERALRVDASRRSFLVVNENFNTGWEARVGGKELRPVRLDGWKQGWVVPAGTTGTVELTYRPDIAQRATVAIGLGLVLLLFLVAVRPWRPGRARARPPVSAGIGTSAGLPGWAVAPLAAGLGGWVAGVPGLAVALGTVLVYGWARRRETWARRPLASPWVPAVLLVAGTGCLATGYELRLLDNPLSPSGHLGDIVPQLLGVVILARVSAALWRPHRAGGGDPGASIELRWARPPVDRPRPAPSVPSQPSAGNGRGAEPDAPPRSGSRSRLRWSPRGSEEDRSAYSPGTNGRSTRTSRR